MGADRDGDISGKVSIVCPDTLADAVARTVSSCYRDSRLLPGATLPPLQRLVRLKKRNNLVHALRGTDDESHGRMDSLLAQDDGARESGSPPVRLRPRPCALRSLPPLSLCRLRTAGGAGSCARPTRECPAPSTASTSPGYVRSDSGRSWKADSGCCTDRCSSPTSASPLRASGRVRPSRVRWATNQPRRTGSRFATSVLGSGIYLRRLKAGIANPVPAWRRGVISSVELAAMWHVPRRRAHGGEEDAGRLASRTRAG